MASRTEKPTAATVNQAPGFQCPVCQKAMIRLSFDHFLDANSVRCPACDTPFTMNKSDCAQFVDLLQQLRIAQRNVAVLKDRSGRS